jgi:hypothetical protein
MITSDVIRSARSVIPARYTLPSISVTRLMPAWMMPDRLAQDLLNDGSVLAADSHETMQTIDREQFVGVEPGGVGQSSRAHEHRHEQLGSGPLKSAPGLGGGREERIDQAPGFILGPDR